MSSFCLSVAAVAVVAVTRLTPVAAVAVQAASLQVQGLSAKTLTR
jgi:hypothetical protein